MKRLRMQLVIAFIVFICGVSLMGLVYIVFNKPDVYVNPGIVVSAPSPVAVPAQHVGSRRSILSQPTHHLSPAKSIQHTYPSQSMPAYKGLYTTSSARVHSVGGGTSGYAISTISGHSSASHGVIYSTVSVAMPSTNFVALASQREIAQPEASEAPQMARLSSVTRRAPGPPNPTNPLDEEHQLIEHPVGDALWPLALMALAYACVVLWKRRMKA